jgi:hypothetical protein
LIKNTLDIEVLSDEVCCVQLCAFPHNAIVRNAAKNKIFLIFKFFNFFRNAANIRYCFEINAEDLKIYRKKEEPISSQDERAPRSERGKNFSVEEPGTSTSFLVVSSQYFRDEGRGTRH